jgi:cytochrome c oxidase assembly protein subunit 11
MTASAARLTRPMTPRARRKARAARTAWVVGGIAVRSTSPSSVRGAGRMSAPKSNVGLLKLVGVALAAFVFTFSLVPLYRIACEKVFGIRLEQGPGQARPRMAPKARTVTVQFDGGVNSKLPWAFHPEQLTMQVVPGEVERSPVLRAQRQPRSAIVGSAVPSVAPARASGYFTKTECFCFTAQTLQPGESRDMPVRFIVDQDLPADVKTITLSYTFFKNDALTAQLGTGTPSPSPLAAPSPVFT